jgi:hypothetical protein
LPADRFDAGALAAAELLRPLSQELGYKLGGAQPGVGEHLCSA